MDDDARVERTLDDYDDLTVVANDLSDRPGLTLTAVVRNETYFLPAFLAHYRALGVERFVFLDDRSDDGTRELLAAQPDCMVVGSSHTFGDMTAPGTWRRGGQVRIRAIWSTLILRKYGAGRWCVFVDADEFLRLPVGMRLQDLVPRLEQLGGTAAWGFMLDLYPATIADLLAQRDDATLDPDGDWYYDARRHATPRRRGGLRLAYPGSRARLMARYRIRRHRGLKALRAMLGPVRYNQLRKVPLMKVPEQGYVNRLHDTAAPAPPDVLLPLEHFRFTGQTLRRAEAAIARKSHFRASVEYEELARLLRAMEAADASFLCPWSSNDRSFEAYRRAGIAQGM